MLTNASETPTIEQISKMLRELPKDKLLHSISLIDTFGMEHDEHEANIGI